MKAIKAKFENGLITLAEPSPEAGPTDVLVVFPELADDPWQRILDDPAPRPALDRYVREVEAEIAAGCAKPSDLGSHARQSVGSRLDAHGLATVATEQ